MSNQIVKKPRAVVAAVGIDTSNMTPTEVIDKKQMEFHKCGKRNRWVFGGSGSTLIACEQLNRKAYLMELEPKWCDVIVKRWEEFTGKKAVKIN